MRKRITLSTFRKIANAEEAMMRAMMPSASANDPAPLASPILPRTTLRTLGNGARLVKPLTATLAEVANA